MIITIDVIQLEQNHVAKTARILAAFDFWERLQVA
jgi:hypothetical protein